jgi:hypothetical protein
MIRLDLAPPAIAVVSLDLALATPVLPIETKPTGFVIPLIASPRSAQRTPPTGRRRRNPHSV